MKLRRLRVAFELLQTLLSMLSLFLRLFVFLFFPVRFKRWRAASRFRRVLTEEGLPKPLVQALCDSQFKPLDEALSLRRWMKLALKSREKGR